MKFMFFALFLSIALIFVGCSQLDSPTSPFEPNVVAKLAPLSIISPANHDTSNNPVHFSWTKFPEAAYYVFHWSQVIQSVNEDKGATMYINPDSNSTITGDTVFVNIRGFGQGTTHYWRVDAYSIDNVQIANTTTFSWYIRKFP